MPVYPVAAGIVTSCASPGCWCRDRRPCYPSDLTDDQWAVLEPRAREVMSELTVAVGRPMVHDLRAMCDAVSYVVKNGVEWRALPADFPPWESAYAFFERWNGRGLPAELVRRLRELLRQHQGRAAQPTACIVDSQMVKAHDTVSKATSGYHGGKKITGRGRHLAVDTEGWLLALVVTAASASDKAGAKILLIKLFDAFSTLRIMWADTGYNGAPLGRRWVVERTFGWLMRYRRLARDYERTTASSEAMIYWATVIIMTRRLARYENGQPPAERWGGARPRSPQQAALSTGSKALSGAAAVPMQVVEVAAQVAQVAAYLAREGNPNLRGDAITAAALAEAGARAAALSGGLAAPRSPHWTSTTSTAGSAAPRQRKPWTRPSKPTSPITWPAGTFS